ncbi:S1C family serine protease [Corynebacterium cystitidis]|uniref:S1C family serine protease n=1 Tax=Corynebacterium cystitidis TaxID=35757 RepID=UPI000B94D96B|nr:serine protease, heat shock protein [Corynebacterium cystitidis]
MNNPDQRHPQFGQDSGQGTTPSGPSSGSPGYPYGAPNTGTGDQGPHNYAPRAEDPQHHSAQGHFQQLGPYQQPGPYPQHMLQDTKQKEGIGAGTAIALAVVTSLVVGGVTGYVAGNTGSTKSYSAIEQPSVSSSEPAPEGSVEQVAEQVLPAVVSIQVASAIGVADGSGSIISSDGYVLTNHHVVSAQGEGSGAIQVTLNNGEKHVADYVASDVNTDIAVIKIRDVEGLPVLNFGDSNELAVGQQVVAVGSPLGLSATVTSGIVSALNRPVRAAQGGGESSLIDAIQTDAAINPGNSGGPLVDMNGNLIGINSVIASLSTSSNSAGSIGLGFAIPSNFAKRVVDQLINEGEASQPMLGVQVDSRNPVDGALVVGVPEGGPAAAAGIEEGDVIVQLNDRQIDTADALIAATRSQDFGETVTLLVHPRDSEETREVEVTLSSE